MKTPKLVLSGFILLWSALATAGDDEASHNKGDFKTSAKELQESAKRGNAEAQGGVTHRNGQDVYAQGSRVSQDTPPARDVASRDAIMMRAILITIGRARPSVSAL